MQNVSLPNGEQVPALGLGTWRMGDKPAQRKAEADALRLGLDLGLTLIDTAEMYAEGGAEEVVADAIDGRRDEVFLVSKVYPHNASLDGAIAACERSLDRLRTDRIDLYLLHWRGQHPLADTVSAFETLKADGKIRHWGVSNFDVADLEELSGVAPSGACAANQVLYHMAERGIEWRLIDKCQSDATVVMAYTPFGDGVVLASPLVHEIGKRHGVEASAVALAWILRHDGMMVIPKASTPAHVRANAQAANLVLDPSDMEALDQAFPPPRGPSPLVIA